MSIGVLEDSLYAQTWMWKITAFKRAIAEGKPETGEGPQPFRYTMSTHAVGQSTTVGYENEKMEMDYECMHKLVIVM